MDYLVGRERLCLAIGSLNLALYLMVPMLLRGTGTRPGDDETRIGSLGLRGIADMRELLLCLRECRADCAVAWVCTRIRKQGLIACARVGIAGVVPASPRHVLGARSLKDMWLYIHRASFTSLNGHLLPLNVARFPACSPASSLRAVGRFLVYLALLVLNGQFRGSQAWPHLRVAGSVTPVLGLTLLAHWLPYVFWIFLAA